MHWIRKLLCIEDIWFDRLFCIVHIWLHRLFCIVHIWFDRLFRIISICFVSSFFLVCVCLGGLLCIVHIFFSVRFFFRLYLSWRGTEVQGLCLSQFHPQHQGMNQLLQKAVRKKRINLLLKLSMWEPNRPLGFF